MHILEEFSGIDERIVMRYFMVKDNKVAYRGFPSRYRLPDGTTKTDLSSLPHSELVSYGFYPVTFIPPPEYDFEKEVLREVLTIDEENKTVTISYIKEKNPDYENLVKQYILENEYLEATRNLVLLSGGLVAEGDYPKLEDVEFKQISMLAMQNNPNMASLLLNTLNYTFFQLKFGCNVRWEDIQHREVVQ